MANILNPDLLERLQICQGEIRRYADRRDDMLAVRDMARVATSDIVPEIDMWRNVARIELAADRVRFTLDASTGHDREVAGELFMLSGILDGKSLYETLEPIDQHTVYSEYDLCLRFKPAIESDQTELVLAESVLVPVSSIALIDKAIDE